VKRKIEKVFNKPQIFMKSENFSDTKLFCEIVTFHPSEKEVVQKEKIEVHI
jgi:hypothetical protein